jgi:hypothetical protein
MVLIAFHSTFDSIVILSSSIAFEIFHLSALFFSTKIFSPVPKSKSFNGTHTFFAILANSFNASLLIGAVIFFIVYV